MKVGVVYVVGQEKVCEIVEKEFEKEISTLEIKRYRIPGIESSPMAARILAEDSGCDFVVIPYQLEEDEKLGMEFNLGISLAEFWLKKPIFKILVYPDEDPEKIVKDAVQEIIMFYYRPGDLEKKKSEEEKEEPKPQGFSIFGNF